MSWSRMCFIHPEINCKCNNTCEKLGTGEKFSSISACQESHTLISYFCSRFYEVEIFKEFSIKSETKRNHIFILNMSWKPVFLKVNRSFWSGSALGSVSDPAQLFFFVCDFSTEGIERTFKSLKILLFAGVLRELRKKKIKTMVLWKSLPMAGGWIKIVLKVLCNPKHSWFYDEGGRTGVRNFTLSTQESEQGAIIYGNAVYIIRGHCRFWFSVGNC